MPLKSKFICPFCFEEHKLSEIQFRCTNKRCEDVPDVELTKYEDGDIDNPLLRKTCFSVKKKLFFLPKSGVCPKCKSISHAVVCPSCHNKLPESTLKGRDMIISVVGSRGSGKSHFVGVIIYELLKRISVRFDGALIGFDDSLKRYEAGAYNRLYNEKEKMEMTKSSMVNINNGAYKPLIFTLQFRKKNCLKPTINNFTLVFFDTAGEDLDDEDTMSTVNKYICKSSGIIFLLDPMRISKVRNQLDSDIVSCASAFNVIQGSSSDDIMTRVSNLIRKDKNLTDDDLINIPVAAVFSKFDAIVPLIPDGSVVLEESPHCSKKLFDVDDWFNVNTEIKSLLSEWGESPFISQTNLNYKNCSYFSISALGLNNNPSNDGKIETPRPHRIEDPLLWILKENGVIKASKHSKHRR